MNSLLALLSVALAGCASAPVTPTAPTRSAVSITVIEAPELLRAGERGRAYIQMADGVPYACRVVLRKYPQCLQHEIRHCLEGDWHKSQPHNTQDCN